MNKTKIIRISIGGVVLLGALVLAYLIWSAWEAKSENAEALEFAVDGVCGLAAGVELKSDPGAKVYPGENGVKAVTANRERYAEWIETSRTAASVGDRRFDSTTPPAFKAKMVEDAKRLAALPGDVAGKLVKDGFGFGFTELVHGGELPKAEDLPRLQREWNDVVLVVDLLAEAGIASVEEIAVVKAGAAEAAVEDPKAAKKAKKKRAKAAEEEVAPPAVTAFTIAFRSSASGLVGALNALTANDRFIITEDLRFSRGGDPIVEKLGGGKIGREQDTAATGRRGRRGRVQVQAVEETEDKRQGVICDPQSAPALKVSMKVSVYDFHTAEKAAPAGQPAAQSGETEE